MLQRFILFILLASFSFNLIGAEREYVNTLDDFYLHMHNHVSNVEIMADRLFEEMKRNPAKWRRYFNIPADVPIDNKLKKIITGFITLHDASKLNTDKAFLKKINRKTGLINDLYSVYGKSFKDMTGKEKSIVDALNIVDKAERDAYIKKLNLPEWAINMIDDVEKISDGVERGMNAVTSEEMAKKVVRESEFAQTKLTKAIADKLPEEEIKRLKQRLELILQMEDEYNAHTVKFKDYRTRMHSIGHALRESGVLSEYLDEFSTYRFIEEYENFIGKKIDVKDPNLVKNLKSFFFKNNNGVALLKSSFRPDQQNAASIMFELGHHEMNPNSAGKWKNLFETFEGVCH